MAGDSSAVDTFCTETRELQFSGAFNKLTYIHNNQINEIIGNKYPIGGWQLEQQRTFKSHSLILKENTSVYLYSDGFKDQFGYVSKKRFSSKRFKDLLLISNERSMEKQKQTIENEFNRWKCVEEQIDDVCVLGLQF